MKRNFIVARHIDDTAVVERRVKNTDRIVFRHVDLIENTKAAFLGTAVNAALPECDLLVLERIGSDQLGTSRIYMEGNVVRRSSENVRQCLRQHIFSRCLFAGQQQIFALQKRGNRHLQNLFSKKRDFRRAHAVL